MGTAIDVAFPAALVMVAPSAKVVVPAGANHTVLAAFPLGLAIVMAGYYLIWKYLLGFFNRMLEIA